MKEVMGKTTAGEVKQRPRKGEEVTEEKGSLIRTKGH